MTERLQVLLIDDHEAIRTLVGDALFEHGIDVAGVASAEDALVLLASGQIPDVLVTDINLGAGLDGLTLADLARARHPGVEIIFISGDPKSSEERVMGRHQRLLRKPFVPAKLIQAIRDAVRR